MVGRVEQVRDRVEEADAFLLRAQTLGLTVGSPFELGEDCGDDRRALPRTFAFWEGCALERLGVLRKDLDPWGVRGPSLALVARAEAHDRPVGSSKRRDLPHEPSFSDARLPEEHRDSALAGGRRRDQFEQRRLLALAPDECRLARQDPGPHGRGLRDLAPFRQATSSIRRVVTATTGGFDPNDVAGLRVARHLGRQLFAVEQVAAGRTRRAALSALRRMAPPLADDREAAGLEDPQFADDAVAATMPARATGAEP